MKCYLIYYFAKKTALCEKALKTELSGCGVSVMKILGAADPEYLGNMMTDGLNHCNIVITVGGLNSSGDISLEKTLSSAVEKAGGTMDDVQKLPYGKNHEKFGYIIERGSQCIVALPDSPEGISELFDEPLSKYFEEKVKNAENKKA